MRYGGRLNRVGNKLPTLQGLFASALGRILKSDIFMI